MSQHASHKSFNKSSSKLSGNVGETWMRQNHFMLLRKEHRGQPSQGRLSVSRSQTNKTMTLVRADRMNKTSLRIIRHAAAAANKIYPNTEYK